MSGKKDLHFFFFRSLEVKKVKKSIKLLLYLFVLFDEEEQEKVLLIRNSYH